MAFPGIGVGTVQADANGNLTTISDDKFKTDIKNYTAGLADVLKVHTKCYRYNAVSGLDTKNEYCGFTAEDLQNAIPSAVFSNQEYIYIDIPVKSKDDGSDTFKTILVPVLNSDGSQSKKLSIDLRAITAAELNAIGQLSFKIDAMQATIDAQQKQIDELKTRIDKAGIR